MRECKNLAKNLGKLPNMGRRGRLPHVCIADICCMTFLAITVLMNEADGDGAGLIVSHCCAGCAWSAAGDIQDSDHRMCPRVSNLFYEGLGKTNYGNRVGWYTGLGDVVIDGDGDHGTAAGNHIPGVNRAERDQGIFVSRYHAEWKGCSVQRVLPDAGTGTGGVGQTFEGSNVSPGGLRVETCERDGAAALQGSAVARSDVVAIG